MKLLYVDVSTVGVNPTANLTPLLVRLAASEFVPFGPGFSSHHELSLGLRHFCELRGPFDAVVFGPNVPLLAENYDQVAIDGAIQYLTRFTALAPTSSIMESFFKDVYESIDGLDIGIKIASALNFDFYAASVQQMDSIARRGIYLLGPNQQFVSRVEDLPDFAKQEKHYARKINRIGNAYVDFVSSQPQQVITAAHFVAETEFAFRHWDDRVAEVSVPGAEYVLREQAIARLKEEGIAITRKSIFYIYKLLAKLKLPVLSKFLSLRIYQLSFVQELMTSRVVYTARGGFGLPIRKFFEIPAAGALLICSSPYGFRDMGFRNGEHYIESDPELLAATVRQSYSEPERHAAIAKAGQDLVFERHSLRARASQLRICLDAIVAGRYRGSVWSDGEFKLIS